MRGDDEDPMINEQLARIAQSYSADEANAMIPEFLDIVRQVFTIDSPKATQKIGLTYLASIIK
jgi:hypothetical protein